jgi:DNA processing protein
VKAESAIEPLKKGMETNERFSLIALSHVEFLRPREKLLLIEALGGAAGLFELSLAEIAGLVGRRLTTGLWKPDEILRSAATTEDCLTASGVRSIFYWDSSYPPQLREIYDPPVTLYLRGTLPDSGLPLAGIVGTRFPTGGARTAAFRLGFELGMERIGVVSGLARGVDREAHEGSVTAGGYSIAVLGNGIDLVYPESSRAVAMTILERGGAIVSEYPPGIPPLKYHFPARNRIISGLSRAVVVVQAPERSGALITAEYALDQGRDLYVHAAGLAGSTGAGTRRLADCGAPVIRGSDDILRDWGMAPGKCAEYRAGTRSADSAPGRKQTHAFPHGMAEGERLALMLKEEINGACAVKGGEPFWRT